MYKQLKALFFMNDIQYTDIAEWIGRSKSYVSSAMNHHTLFTIEEVYIICDKMGIDLCDIKNYFPFGGKKNIPVKSLKKIS